MIPSQSFYQTVDSVMLDSTLLANRRAVQLTWKNSKKLDDVDCINESRRDEITRPWEREDGN